MMTRNSDRPASRLVLGIDPGTSVTGYGLLRCDGDRLRAVESGVIRLGRPGPDMPLRLKVLFEELESLLARTAPDVLAVETAFSHLHSQSALKLAQARGVVLLAAARAGVEIRQYAPREVKAAVACYGAADKAQVQTALIRLLGLPERELPQDASDALAVAVCEANAAPMRRMLAEREEGALRGRT